MLSDTLVRSFYLIFLFASFSLAWILKPDPVVRQIVFDHDSKTPIRVKYGEHIKIICGVGLRPPFYTIWQTPSRILQGPRSESERGRELDIPSMNVSLHREYITCSVSSQPNQRLLDTAGTHLEIDNLEGPIIELGQTKVEIMEKTTLNLTCKVIGGVPEPTILWQFKGSRDKSYGNLTETGELLSIQGVDASNHGTYRCEATNLNGTAEQTTDVTVLTAPNATIHGDNMTVVYGSEVTLQCAVSGEPAPSVQWTDDAGKPVNSKENEISLNEMISEIKVMNVKRSTNYSCHATNRLGKAEDTGFVNVLSPFVVHEYPQSNITIHNGNTSTIVCNITSSLPISIKWYKDSDQILPSNVKYDLSDTKLTIKQMEFKLKGNYSCVASLTSDESENISYSTHVDVDGLEMPQIRASSRIIVSEDNWITLNCEIAHGVPEPTIQWMVANSSVAKYEEITNATKEDLDFPRINISQAGLYMCVVKNPLGEVNMTIELAVRKAPVMTIKEGSSVDVVYGSNFTITCSVVAFPLPSQVVIFTRKVNGTNITEPLDIGPKDIINVSESERVYSVNVTDIRLNSTYDCTAANAVGTGLSSLNINVFPPFIVHHTPESTTNVHYNNPTTIVCNITSHWVMTISWFHNGSEIVTSDNITISQNSTELTIKSVDNLTLQGSYKCKASLVDKSESVDFTTELKIDDLELPKVTKFRESQIFKELQPVTLSCETSGNPKPVVTWKGPKGDNIGTGDSISTTNFGKDQYGQYTCIATSILGSDQYIFGYVGKTD